MLQWTLRLKQFMKYFSMVTKLNRRSVGATSRGLPQPTYTRTARPQGHWIVACRKIAFLWPSLATDICPKIVRGVEPLPNYSLELYLRVGQEIFSGKHPPDQLRQQLMLYLYQKQPCLIMSKDFMPPVMMKGLRRSTFPVGNAMSAIPTSQDRGCSSPFLSRETRSLGRKVRCKLIKTWIIAPCRILLDTAFLRTLHESFNDINAGSRKLRPLPSEP